MDEFLKVKLEDADDDIWLFDGYEALEKELRKREKEFDKVERNNITDKDKDDKIVNEINNFLHANGSYEGAEVPLLCPEEKKSNYFPMSLKYVVFRI